MKIWLDAHLPWRLAGWIESELGLTCRALRDLGLRDAQDKEIFQKAKQEDVVMMTKDSDFIDLVRRLGPPPKVIWLRCGNTSEQKLKLLLKNNLQKICLLIEQGNEVIEIRG